MQYQSFGILEKPVPSHQSKGQSVLLSNLVVFSHCFYSVLGYSAAWMGQKTAPGSSGQHFCCLHLWRDFSGCRKEQGSKAASSKIKECDIPGYLTAWKAFLCPVLPFIFLSMNIWLLKLFLVWKPWSNLLLIKASISLFSVLSSWCSWAFLLPLMLPAPDPCWFVAFKWQQIFPWSLASLSCVFKLHLDGTFN